MPDVKSTSWKLRKVYSRVSIRCISLGFTLMSTLSHYRGSSRVRTRESNISRGMIPISATNSRTETVSYIFAGRRWMAAMAHTQWGLLLGQEVESSSKPSLRRNLSSSTKRILLQETHSRTTTTNRYLSPIRRSVREQAWILPVLNNCTPAPLAGLQSLSPVKCFKSPSATWQPE